MITPPDFIAKHNGKPMNFDSVFGNQCVDVFKYYNHEVVGGPTVSGNAVDYWDKYPTAFYTRIEYKPGLTPQLGDVVVWSKDLVANGHIAICVAADGDSFVSFDQNWPTQVDANGNGVGVAHYQPHSYAHVKGWLRPKFLDVPAPEPTNPDQVKVNLGEPWGTMEVQAIRSTLNDMKRDITSKDTQIKDLVDQLNNERENTRKAKLEAEYNLNMYDSERTRVKRITEIVHGKGWPWTKINHIKSLLQSHS